MLLVIVVPIAFAAFAFGCFAMAGLLTGIVFGTLDALGLVKWSDQAFLIATGGLAIVLAVCLAVFRDDIRDW